ncbi:MAG TPA: hypothetical protein VI756_20455 [Blastocatellia bacterium]
MSEQKKESTPPKAQIAESKIIDPRNHPSRVLDLRKNGYGIGGGYERPLKQPEKIKTDNREGLYGPIPTAGYYGGGTADIRFKVGQAGFRDELSWYRAQYGEETGLSKNTK